MLNKKKITAVIVAAGSSVRMGFDKLFHPINGVEVIRHTADKIATHPAIDEIVLVAGENIERVKVLFAAYPLQKPLHIVRGGSTRAASVAIGAAACADADFVAIHDGARPFVSHELITRTLEAALQNSAAAPAVPLRDTVKQTDGEFIAKTIPRSSLVAMQTPQVFSRAEFVRALGAIPIDEYGALTDDCMVMERAGLPVCLVEGELANKKITTPEDFDAQSASPARIRIGHGYDVHAFQQGRRLVLGGVEIEHSSGLLGHSDADVLLHAIADALLGAAAMGDIGVHFPNTAPQYEGISSVVLLKHVAQLIQSNGYQIQNIDATILCQQPKLASHIPSMRSCIAQALGMATEQVSVKATTEEGLGFTGRMEGISAHCVALVQKIP